MPLTVRPGDVVWTPVGEGLHPHLRDLGCFLEENEGRIITAQESLADGSILKRDKFDRSRVACEPAGPTRHKTLGRHPT